MLRVPVVCMLSAIVVSKSLALVRWMWHLIVRWMLHDTRDNQRLTVAIERRANQVTVHPSDELKRYFLGANRFTFAMIRAAAKVFGLHRGHHANGSLIALRLTLGERVEVGEFGGGEEHCGCVWTSSDASAATNTGSRIEGSVRGFLWYKDSVGIRSTARGRADETSCLNDSVKR